MKTLLNGKVDEYFFNKGVETVSKRKNIPFTNLLDTKMDYREGVDFVLKGLKVDFTTYPYSIPREGVVMVIRDEDALDVAPTEAVVDAILSLADKSGSVELKGYQISRR